MLKGGRLALAGVCLVWGTLGVTPPPTSGCYRLAATAFPDSLPLLIKLTDEPSPQYIRPQAKSVKGYLDSLGRVRGPYYGRFEGHWYQIQPDSLEVWWEESDLDGIAFHAHRSSDSLVGLANWFSDRVVVGVPERRYKTIFVRRECP